jgi:hypothetical protein
MTPGRSAVALAAALLAAAAPARAAERIAVLEFTGSIGDELRRALSDRTRAAALGQARDAGYDVMSRESTALVVEQMGARCLEGQCELEIARTVGAALLVTGEVHRIEAAFVADLKLHDTAKGTLLAVEGLRGKDELDLLDQAEAATARLLAAGLDRFRAPPDGPVRRRGATLGAPLRRHYVEVRLGRRVDGEAPMTVPGAAVPEYPVVLGVRIGRRLDPRWAMELGVGSGEAWGSAWYDSGRVMSSEARWIAAGAVWRAPPDGPFSYVSAAADVGVAFVHAEYRPIIGVMAPAGTAPSTVEVVAPTAGVEARVDLPLGPFALGVRAGGVFMWSGERAANPGSPREDWLVPGVFRLWAISAAVQYALPF